MTKHNNSKGDELVNLRSRAENDLESRSIELPEVSTLSTSELRKLVKELLFEKAELEKQNEELRRPYLELRQSRDWLLDPQQEVTAVQDQSGNITRSRLGLWDITEQQRVENELRISEERLKLVLEGSREGFWDWNIETGQVHRNKRWAEMLGYTIEEIQFTVAQWDDLIHPDDREAAWRSINDHLEGRTAQHETEYRMLTKDNQWKWILDRAKVVSRDKHGKPIRMAGTQTDMTECKKMEALTQREGSLRLLLNSTGEAIYGIDKEGNCTFCNPACLHMLAFTDPDQLIGKNMHWLMHHSHSDGTPYAIQDCRIFRALRKGEGVNVDDEVFWRADGSSFPVEYWSYPQWRDGALIGAVATFIDITERKRMEEALRSSHDELERRVLERTAELSQSEARFHAFMENGPMFAFIKDEHGRFVYVNQKWLTEWNPKEKAWLGATVNDIFDAETASRFAATDRAVLESGKTLEFEFSLTRPDGNLAHWWTSKFLWEDAEGKKYIGGQALIVTDRKRAEEALRLSEQRLRLLIEASPVGITLLQDNNYVFVNPACLRMFGYDSQEEIAGVPVEELFAPEVRKTLKDRKAARLAGKPVPSHDEIKGLRKDGKSFDVALSVTVIDYGGQPALLSFLTDVTEAKSLRAQLNQSQKMEAIGTLAGGIAHDFNNMLYAIIGHTELSLSNLSNPTKLTSYLNKIMIASRRSADLVKQILLFSRPSQIELKPLQVEPIVKEGFKLLRASIPSTIEMRLVIARDLGIVMANPTQFHQVVMNLCTNAAHAMRDKGGVLTVALSNEEISSQSEISPLDITPGKYVKLAVTDNGTGMSPDVIDRVFEPYFTTKEQGEGTGLGLAVVHGIVKRFGGSVKVRSAVGRGSTFEVYLPVILDQAGLQDIPDATTVQRWP